MRSSFLLLVVLIATIVCACGDDVSAGGPGPDEAGRPGGEPVTGAGAAPGQRGDVTIDNSVTSPSPGSGAAPTTVVGSGKRSDENRNLSGFTRIEHTGSLDLQVTQAETFQVTVSLDDNLIPLVETTVVDGTLHISHKPNSSFSTELAGPHVRVALPHLSALQKTGSGSATLTTNETTPLSLEQHGSGTITFTGAASNLDVTIAGSGTVALHGKASELDLTVTGSGIVDAEKLTAARGHVDLTGSGIVKTTLTESASVTATGSGTIELFGGAELTQTDAESAKHVIRR